MLNISEYYNFYNIITIFVLKIKFIIFYEVLNNRIKNEKLVTKRLYFYFNAMKYRLFIIYWF